MRTQHILMMSLEIKSSFFSLMMSSFLYIAKELLIYIEQKSISTFIEFHSCEE